MVAVFARLHPTLHTVELAQTACRAEGYRLVRLFLWLCPSPVLCRTMPVQRWRNVDSNLDGGTISDWPYRISDPDQHGYDFQSLGNAPAEKKLEETASYSVRMWYLVGRAYFALFEGRGRSICVCILAEFVPDSADSTCQEEVDASPPVLPCQH